MSQNQNQNPNQSQSQNQRSVTLEKYITAMTKARESLEKQVKILEDQSKQLVDENFQLEVLEKKKEAIRVELSEEERRAKAELDIALLENEDERLSSLLDSRGLAKITIDELAKVNKERQAAIKEAAEAFNNGYANGSTTTEAKVLEERVTKAAEHKVEVAEKDATISALKTQITYLTDSVTQLQESLNAERDARVSIAKNTPPHNIVVGEGK